MNLRKKEKIIPNCRARIKAGFTKNKICEVKFFDKTAIPPRWYVIFDDEWCGWYHSDNLERLD